MSLVPVLATLETDRLILRLRRVDEAAIYRQLWTERDLRVPLHRRISPEGRLPPRYGVLERIGNPERWAGRLNPVGSRNGGERLCIQRAR
jgi:hypothetical protein